MSEPNSYLQEQERRRRMEKDQELQRKPTMEVVEMHRRDVTLPRWQQWTINILAMIGGLTIAYLVLDLIF